MAELMIVIVLLLIIFGIGELIARKLSTRNRNKLVPFNRDMDNWRSDNNLSVKNTQKRLVNYKDLPIQLQSKIRRIFLHRQDQYSRYNPQPSFILKQAKTEWINKSNNFGNRLYFKNLAINQNDLSILNEASSFSLSEQLMVAIKGCDSAFGNYPVSKPRPVHTLNPPEQPILFKIADLGDNAFFESVKNEDTAILNSYLDTLYAEANEKYDLALKKHSIASEATEAELMKATANWELEANDWNAACLSDKNELEAIQKNVCSTGSIEQIIGLALRSVPFPDWLPNVFSTSFDVDKAILVIDHQFPFIDEIEWFKLVELKTSMSSKSLSSAERKRTISNLYPLITLAISKIAVNNVNHNDIKLVVVNGWVDYRSKETGEEKRAFCSSLVASPEEIKKINLTHAEPLAAFKMLKGIISPSVELAPIAPKFRLNMQDDRFVEGKEVLQGLSRDENLASMDWEDFEHLCRQLFEKVFATVGATVSVTKASRDQGVDAVILDPDPIRGGKMVIQAKRYVNTVDVSAVRDLWGVVSHEGAMKGLLVTTSTFGPDSYAFAQGKPITLINGGELLHLLEAHGYKFRINLEEARQIQRDSGLPSFHKRR